MERIHMRRAQIGAATFTLLFSLIFPVLALAATCSSANKCPSGQSLYYVPSSDSCPRGSFVCRAAPAPVPASTPVAAPLPTPTKPVSTPTKPVASVGVKILGIMSLGSRGDAVLQIQQLLIQRGYLTSDSATAYFGPKTRLAVQSFQRDQAIVSGGDEASTGYGAIGPRTKALLGQVTLAEGSGNTSGSSGSVGASTLPPPPPVYSNNPTVPSYSFAPAYSSSGSSGSGGNVASNTLQGLLAQIQSLKDQIARVTNQSSQNSNTSQPTYQSPFSYTPPPPPTYAYGQNQTYAQTQNQNQTQTQNTQTQYQQVQMQNTQNQNQNQSQQTQLQQQPQSCPWNSLQVPNGQTVAAYQSASVPFGQTCQLQTRTCQNGSLSGSYNGATCEVASAQSCIFNGETIAHNASTPAYAAAEVSAGSTCVPQTRTCQNGVLSGTATHPTCSVAEVQPCTVNGVTVANGATKTFFSDAGVPFGESCSNFAQARTCTNGTLSGTATFKFASCTVGQANACAFKGITVGHGDMVNAFQSTRVPFGQSCTSQLRSCQNGVLSGAYEGASCAVETPESCTFARDTIAHGDSVSAFESTTVPFGQTCRSQIRSCSNGTLSGTYQGDSCTVSAPAACTFNGSTIASGDTTSAFARSSVPFGSNCNSVLELRTCQNGVLSGTATNAVCTVASAASCTLNGQVIENGNTIVAFQSASVASGSQCVQENRTCQNGSLNGSFTAPACAVAEAQQSQTQQNQTQTSQTQQSQSLTGSQTSISSGISGYNWTDQASAGGAGWDAVVSSADGNRLIGFSHAQKIVISVDGGRTWSNGNWPYAGLNGSAQIAASSDGMRLVAAATNYAFGNAAFARFLVASQDGGLTWSKKTEDAYDGNWRSIASSADGRRLIASNIPYGLFTSSDGGTTWVRRVGASAATSLGPVASSADGLRLVYAIPGGQLYTSSDGGATWTPRPGAGNRPWYSIISSADGMRLAAVFSFGSSVLISTDGGATWSENTVPGSRNPNYITMSADGAAIAITTAGGLIYTSSDGGTTWTPQMQGSNLGQRNWSSIAMSANGDRIIAGESLRSLFTAVPGTLNDVAAQASSGLSWNERTIPSEIRGFYSLALSRDGRRIALVGRDNAVYTSADAGASLIKRTGVPAYNTLTIASSGDGMKLAITQYGGFVYVSSDAGATWRRADDIGSFAGYQNGITVSGDGSKLAVIDSASNVPEAGIETNKGYIYTSQDGGITWTPRQRAARGFMWYSIWAGAEGNKLAAVAGGDGLYVSSDAGASWARRAQAHVLASSGDGTKLYGMVAGDPSLKVSTDNGVTWTKIAHADAGQSWIAVGASQSGSVIVAAKSDGYLYLSTDSGATWTKQVGAKFHAWTSVSVSSDGSSVAAVSASYPALYTATVSASANSGSTLTVPASITEQGGGSTTTQTSQMTQSTTSTSCPFNGQSIASGGTVKAYQSQTAAAGTPCASETRTCTNGTLSGSYQFALCSAACLFNGTSVADGGNTPAFQTRYAPQGSQCAFELRACTNGSLSGSYTFAACDVAVFNSGYTWKPQTLNGTWRAAWLNSNGSRITVMGYEVGKPLSIYTTLNGGANWTRTAVPDSGFGALAASSDGQKLLIAGSPGAVHTSTDGGTTWSEKTSLGTGSWRSPIISADGTRMAVIKYIDPLILYLSTNSGATWTQVPGLTLVRSIAASADLSTIAAATLPNLQISTDGGVTWTTAPGVSSPTGIAVSSDGARMITSSSGPMYSTDRGVTWTRSTNSPTGGTNWSSVVMSADGLTIVGGGNPAPWLGISRDGGQTWTDVTADTGTYGVAISADGSRIVSFGVMQGIFKIGERGNTVAIAPQKSYVANVLTALEDILKSLLGGLFR